ncbi:hypothetical protein Tco_0879874 [Tanacetum coccineum]
MERGFLSQKESGGGRGVKEKKNGDGGAHDALSGANQMSNKVDNVGMDGDEISASTLLVDTTSTIHIEDVGNVPVWVKLYGVPIVAGWSHFNRSNSLSLYKD